MLQIEGYIFMIILSKHYKKSCTSSIISYVKLQIERIQNRMLLQQYYAKLKLLEKQNPPNCTNERMLWHGTANEAVPSINTYGFNRSYCGKNGMFYCNMHSKTFNIVSRHSLTCLHITVMFVLTYMFCFCS